MSDDKKNEQQPDNQGSDNSGWKLGRQILFWAALMGAVLIALSLINTSDEPVEKEVGINTFTEHVNNGNVRKIAVKGREVKAWLKQGKAPYGVMELALTDQYISDHLDQWRKKLPEPTGGEKVLTYAPEQSWLPIILANGLPFLLLVGFMIYLVNRQMKAVRSKGGGLPFVKNNTQQARKEKPEVSFDDVAGIEEAQSEVQEIVEFLKDPDKFQSLGGRVPRGLLLVGRPGTGKTLLAKAIAGEADVPFFSLCGSDFVELFVGVGASRVRDLFDNAKENQPCIIFLDEIDAVGRKRGAGVGGGHDEREQTLNAILSEMDGFEREDGVIVLAATNRPDVLDKALLRPGRFDRQITVDMPDIKGREGILEVHTRDVPLADDVDLRELARGTPGFTGADLEAVINEGAIIAAVKDHEKVQAEDLEEARDKVRFGREKRSRVMSEEDRRMTAYHESGHALVAKLHDGVEPLHKVTIMPRGAAMGMTMVLPEEDKYTMRKRECMGMLTMNMAGRVAEEEFCDDISSGAQNDIQQATELARKMITKWGMSSKLGPISYSEDEEHVFLGDELATGKQHSDHMTELIDNEIEELINSSYQKAREMVDEHSEQIEQMAAALQELETLTTDDVDAIFEGTSAEELIQKEQEKEEQEEEEERAEVEPEPSRETEGPDEDESGPEDYPRPAESPA